MAADVFVAPSASVVGEVLMLNEVSVWYGAIVRGDKNKVKLQREATTTSEIVREVMAGKKVELE